MIQKRSEVAKKFSEMQNEIAETFKKFVIDMFTACDNDMSLFKRAMREVATHQRNDYSYKDYEMPDEIIDIVLSVTGGEMYMQFMENEIFTYSEYNEVDIHDLLDEFYDFTFNTMSQAFTYYTEKAIQQFGAGKNIDEKIFRQLAIIVIVREHEEQGIKLTLRQLYYQMVSKNYIVNKEQEYKKIIDLTGNMREACVLALDEFADNTRFSFRYGYHDDPKSFILDRIEAGRYFRDSRENQPHYLEVWIEKEALRTVVKPITDELDVPLFICRGYPSTSSLFDQATSIFKSTKDGRTADEIQEVTILYFGDHDPSGLQIPEAIERIFHESYQMQHVSVVPCALTKAQINRWNLPPNPAKLTDPRAERYIRDHGTQSWELDALPPLELQNIVRRNVDERTDLNLRAASRRQQAEDREKISLVMNHVMANWEDIVNG